MYDQLLSWTANRRLLDQMNRLEAQMQLQMEADLKRKLWPPDKWNSPEFLDQALRQWKQAHQKSPPDPK